MADELYIKSEVISESQKETLDYAVFLKSALESYENSIHNVLSNAIIDEKITKSINDIILSQLGNIPRSIDDISRYAKSKLAKMNANTNEVDKINY